MDHKFGIGAIVRHKATSKQDGTKMVVKGIGTMTTKDGTEKIYLLTGEKQRFVSHDSLFFGSYLGEEDLILANE